MNKFRKFLAVGCLAALALLLCTCGDGDDGDANLEPTPSTETTVEFDNSNFGLYKGVIAGSSGTVKIELFNGDDEAKAIIVMDDETDELVCTSELVEGEAIVDASFSGDYSSFSFSVDADGQNPVIENVAIVGHSNVIASVSKETSENTSFCYEGTTAGGQGHSGVFNCIRNNDTFTVVTKAVDGFSFSGIGALNKDGSFRGSGTTTFRGFGVSVSYTGRFSGDAVSGTWSNSFPGGTNSGSFSGKKTL